LLEFDELRWLDVVVPTGEGPGARLRVMARPEKRLAQWGLELPRTPKIEEELATAVPKNGLSKTAVSATPRSVSAG
jgi:hypothetical protein